MPERFKQWLRFAPGRLVSYLAQALLGLAIVSIVVGVLILLTGQAGSLNNSLADNLGIFGSLTYHPDTDPEIMTGIMNNFYPGVLTFATIMFVLAGVVLVVALLSILAWLGRLVVNLVKSLLGWHQDYLDCLTAFVVWSLTIVVLWLLLNVNATLYYLLTGCALLIIDVLLMWLSGELPASGDPSQGSAESVEERHES